MGGLQVRLLVGEKTDRSNKETVFVQQLSMKDSN